MTCIRCALCRLWEVAASNALVALGEWLAHYGDEHREG